jgi:hypothetical protein
MADTAEFDPRVTNAVASSATARTTDRMTGVGRSPEPEVPQDATAGRTPQTTTAAEPAEPPPVMPAAVDRAHAEQVAAGQGDATEAELVPAAAANMPRGVPYVPQARGETARAAKPTVKRESPAAQEPEPPPTPKSRPAVPRRGIIHPAAKRRTVYHLAAGLACVSAVSLYPAVREVFLHCITETSPGIDPWAPIVILLAVVQFAYALYVVQIPDWSTTRVLMVLTVVVAMVYAMGLGISAMAKLMAIDQNYVILALGLTNEYDLTRIIAWCFLMLLLMCALAYFWARITFKWRRDRYYTVVDPG